MHVLVRVQVLVAHFVHQYLYFKPLLQEFTYTCKNFVSSFSLAATESDYAEAQSPDADDGLNNSNIDKGCLVCGKSESPSKEEDTKNHQQPSNNGLPREENINA